MNRIGYAATLLIAAAWFHPRMKPDVETPVKCFPPTPADVFEAA